MIIFLIRDDERTERVNSEGHSNLPYAACTPGDHEESEISCPKNVLEVRTGALHFILNANFLFSLHIITRDKIVKNGERACSGLAYICQRRTV